MTGQLRHITEESYEEPEFEDVVEEEDVSGNDTNEDALLYFARLSKHYLRLVKNPSESSQSRHTMTFPVIADSGANYHMFRDRQFFSTLSPATGNVILGDGKTTVSILGVGTVLCTVNGHQLEIPNVRYVPGLSESIYSLHLHVQSPSHGLESSYEKGACFFVFLLLLRKQLLVEMIFLLICFYLIMKKLLKLTIYYGIYGPTILRLKPNVS
jgi:hypothetical protein